MTRSSAALRLSPLHRLVRRALPPDETLRLLAGVFRILGHESRVRLVVALGRREARVNDLAKSVGSSVSAVSHQLALLRAHRIVRTRRDGRSIIYALDDEHVAHLVALGLEHIAHP